MIGPSDMMDSRIGAIKYEFLKRGWEKPIISYSAKFSSNFYGPFRDVCKSTPKKFDRKGYQLPCDSKELALKAVSRDISEGADFIMVKPITGYLDIVSEIKKKWDIPVACYHVSGEYAMIHYAALNNSIDKVIFILIYFSIFLIKGKFFLKKKLNNYIF